MLTAANVIEVQAEAEKLNRLPTGNHGRTFRRFLSRVVNDQVLALAFADGTTPMEPKQVKLYQKYAEQHLEKLTAPGRYYDDVEGVAVVVDVKRSYVAIHFPMNDFNESASQNAMRGMVFTVSNLAKTMTAFAENPAGEIYTVSPEGIKERKRKEAEAARERDKRFTAALNRMFSGQQAT